MKPDLRKLFALFTALILMASAACIPQAVPLATPALISSTPSTITGEPGTLTGTVSYQAPPSPASLLYAVNVVNPEVWFRADLPAADGVLTFSLQVTAGTYQLFARTLDGNMTAAIPGAEAKIGMVSVEAGQTVTDLSLRLVAPQNPCQTTSVPASPDGLFPAIEPVSPCVALTEGAMPSGQMGVLSGHIGYGVFPSPASVLYAVDVANPQSYFVLELPASDGLLAFSLQVPPGTYQLLARTQDGAMAAAYHTDEADIGSVTVAAGQTVSDLVLYKAAPETPCQTIAVPASPDGRFPEIKAGPCAGGGGTGGAQNPTPASNLPNKPGSLFFNFTCAGGQATTQFSWEDLSDNEIGFRLYRDGKLLADLPANTTAYEDKAPTSGGLAVVYLLTAYNNYGETDSRSAVVACP